MVHSLLAALPLHTTEVCSLQGLLASPGADGVLLLRAHLVQASVGNVLFHTSPTLTIIGENFMHMKLLTKSSGVFCGGGGGVVGSDAGSASGKGNVAVSGKALIGSTGVAVGEDGVSAGNTNGPWFRY